MGKKFIKSGRLKESAIYTRYLRPFLRDLKRYNFEDVKNEIAHHTEIIKNNYSLPEKRFILLAFGRSGSELLRSLINSHPEIYCENEIFGRSPILARNYADNRSKIYGKKIYGFKAKVYQLDGQYWKRKTVIRKFFSGDFQVIYLYRRNIFRQALSNLLGHQRNRWHDRDQSPLKDKKFIINCDALLRKMEVREMYEEREREILKGLDYLEIIYEDHLLQRDMHQQTLDRVFHFLGVKSVPVNTDLKKTTPKKVPDFVENYEEIYATVRSSKYAHFLD